MFYTRTLKIPIHYRTTKTKLSKLDKLTARLTNAVNLWSKLIDKNKIKNRKELQKLEYQHFVKKQTKLSAGFVQQTGNKALWAWNAYRKKAKRQPYIQKPFSKNKQIAIRFDYRTGKLVTTKVKLSPYAIEISTLKNHEKMFLLLNPSQYPLKKLQAARRVCDFEIIKRKEKYYAYVVCEFKVENIQPKSIRGIDLGINRTITTVLLSKNQKPQIDILQSNEKKALLEKYDSLIAELQSSGKKIKLKQLRNKRKRIADYYDRVITKQLSLLAQEEIVAIGYPKHIRSANKKGNHKKQLRKKVHKWAYKRMIQYITEKFNEKGLVVVPMNEKNTSKKCSCCGSLNTHRPEQQLLICLDCNTLHDADINGAINIALSIRKYAADEPAETSDDFLQPGLKLEATTFRLR